MADHSAPATTGSAAEWTAAEQAERLLRGDDLFVLDVRNRDAHASFPLEGRRPLPTRNVPYFEMLEEGGAEDMVESVVAYVGDRLDGVLPRDRTVVAVCARGETSAFVARGLRKLGYDAVNLAGGMQAWGDHQEVRRVAGDDAPATVHQVSRPARGCTGHVVASRGRAIVVDPLRPVERCLELAAEAGLAIEAVADTHVHADHVSGGAELARRLEVPYFLHPYDAIHPADLLPARVDYRPLRDGSLLRAGDATLEALHVPGHTLGSVAFLVTAERSRAGAVDERPGEHGGTGDDHPAGPGDRSGVDRRRERGATPALLLAGDSVFLRSVARPDLGGAGERWTPLLRASLLRLLDLPGETVVLPGHVSGLDEADGDGVFAARLADLARTNEALRRAREGEEAFRRHVLDGLPEPPRRYAEIKRINLGLAEADEARIGELELGKNLCAVARGREEP